MNKHWVRLICVGTLLSLSSVNTLATSSTSTTNSSTTKITQETTEFENSSSETSSTTSINKSTNSSTNEDILKKSLEQTTLSPKKYGVLSRESISYFESSEDIENNQNAKDSQTLSNQILELNQKIETSTKGIYYQFEASNGTIGFISQTDIQRTETNNYGTISSSTSATIVFKDTKLNETINSALVQQKTFKIQEETTLKDTTFVSIFNSQNEFIGFINKSEVSLSEHPQGSYQSVEKYINITNNNQDIYQNFNFEKKNNTSNFLNKTLLAKGIYYHSNGENYLSVFDKDQKWVGYINQKDTIKSDGRQGNYVEYGKYISLTKKNYDLWNNFSWTPKSKSDQYMKQTLIAKGVYNHFNGERYLSVYTNDDHWIGYINEKATTLADGQQGIYHSFNKYITIKSKNYDLWNNFSWSQRGHSSAYYGNTYKARGIYYHFNGNKYLSVYDNKGKWMGYLNETGTNVTNSPEGTYQKLNKYVSITTSNYDLWQNFNWKKKSSTGNYRNQTTYAKGVYNHYNGSTYYSLFNNKNQWLGYVNKNGLSLAEGSQGIYHSLWEDVTFSDSNYPVWRDFNWSKQNKTDTVKGKTLTARGIYYHYNGSSYYTIYNKNKWIGYINTDAAQNYDMNKLIPNTESLLAVHQIVCQKTLDVSSKPSSIIDKVLSMPSISRSQIKFKDNHFVVSLKNRGLGMEEVKLTPREIAPAVNYHLLPEKQITGAIPKLNKNKKYVALTFDDGPNPRTTPQLLNILKSKNVKASFFMVGNSVNAHPNVAKRVSNEGHQIGSHSYSHPQLTSLSSYQVQSQMRQTDKAIYYATGKLPKTFRPPYGAINYNVSNLVAKPAIMWSIDTRDWESRNPYMINSVVNNNIHNGAIILLHDIHQPSVNSVSDMIDNLKRKGYNFVTIDELYEMQERPLHGYFSQTSSLKY